MKVDPSSKHWVKLYLPTFLRSPGEKKTIFNPTNFTFKLGKHKFKERGQPHLLCLSYDLGFSSLSLSFKNINTVNWLCSVQKNLRFHFWSGKPKKDENPDLGSRFLLLFSSLELLFHGFRHGQRRYFLSPLLSLSLFMQRSANLFHFFCSYYVMQLRSAKKKKKKVVRA